MNISSSYLVDGGGNRICAPSYERLKQLYAFGYTNSQMTKIINSEFHDIDFSGFSSKDITDIISNNSADFKSTREELGTLCREEIQDQVRSLYLPSRRIENTMIEIYIDKLESVLESLRKLDLDEIDDNGNFKNTSRTFVLLEIAEKYQIKIAKVAGTDALREIEIFREKAKVKREEEAKGTGLIQVQGREIPTATTFIQ